MPTLDNARLDEVIGECLARGDFPGAVVLIGHRGEVRYHTARGRRMIVPEERPMEPDTIFDLASVTKPVATATAILQLAEQGRLSLSDPVQEHLPAFVGEHKDAVTVRHLLTHSSGLAAYRNFLAEGLRSEEIIPEACRMPLAHPPGAQFLYSCLNFILLRGIVGAVSGQRLDEYAREQIFEPLGMTDTMFCPPAELHVRCAATEELPEGVLCGVVHDEAARALDGVGGNAGLFSTAADLSRFCQMILNLGELDGVRVLQPATVRLATSPQSLHPGNQRGLGWGLGTLHARTLRGDFFPPGSFGHSGFTGTSIWIDPFSQSYVIILTNRCHPTREGRADPLRYAVANLAGAALAEPRQYAVPRRYFGRTLTGLDKLLADECKPLRGLRLGLITNHTAITRSRRHMVDAFLEQELDVRALFSPEHGWRGELDEVLGETTTTDEQTGLPRHSLYSSVQRPQPDMLEGLDALVYDIADIGARFYTYTTTMAHCMEAAAQAGLRFFVLDRPNPINGREVEGPILDPPFQKLSAHHPVPTRHGLTSGELARFANAEYELGCELEVIACEGWARELWFDETGLPWVNPSPNIRNLTQATLYIALGSLEAANLSVGRGTESPFEVFGAPYINGERLAARLNEQKIAALHFVPVRFTPASSKFAGEDCGGCYVFTTDRERLQPVRASLAIARTLCEQCPEDFDPAPCLHLIGSQAVLEAVQRLDPLEEISGVFAAQETGFRQKREQYLLYG